ncbi:reverse transcriptase domain-containing protein [Tanacetum coccineum]
MDGCTNGPQPEEDENLNTGALETGRTPPRGTSTLTEQVQGGPSQAFVKENIDVMRTMIKELDNQGQEKVTHRKLFNEESGGAGSENSLTSPSAEEVEGYFSNGSSRSRSRGRSRSVRKHQKSVSKKNGISKSHRKSSSDPGYDTVFDSGSEDLSMPYRQPKPMPFTSRITRFRYHRRAKLPPYVWVYEGNKDPEDHLTRNQFDSLDPKSVDGFEELSNKFLEEFSQQKRHDKDPTKIHGIKRKPNEGLQSFMDRFKAESLHIKGVPPVLRISAFMHGHGHPELAKKLNDKIPKIVDEMWERVKAFIRGETASDTTKVIRSPREGFTPLRKTLKEILAMDNVNFPPPPPMVGTLEKRNMNKFRDYHQDRGHNTNDCYHLKKQIEEAVASRRLAHLVKDIRQSGQKTKGSAKGKDKVINMVRSQGYRKRHYEKVEHWMDNAIAFPVRRIYVYGGSSSEIMYEHYFRNLSYRTRSRLRESRKPLVGFSGEVNYPLGVIDLTGMRSLGVVASTIHSMIKFPTSNGIATIATTRETLRECRQIEEAQAVSRHARVIDPSLMQTSSEVTPTDMTGIPRAVMEHRLDTYPHIEPKVQKKRSLALDKRKLVTIEVNEWLNAGIVRRVRYPSWVSNPVLMTKNDEEKTAFHTEEGVFCYTKMPFGLKNAGAAYQRLVDSAFKEQIRVNLEAYVDDMVIKSRTEQDIIKDIDQTFSTLRGINIKLNPKKCSFGMEEVKFLGYIVTWEGIKANPEKKGERSLPFLDTLKKCTNKKDFRWTEAAEATFLEIKKLVSEFPTLTTPKKGETLMMYLAAMDEAVSAVLLTERDGRKMPIHYVSRSLQGAETNYAPIEKLTLALVHAARRLRRYFQAHPIKAIIDSLIKQVLADTSTEINVAPVVASTSRVEDIPESLNVRENLTPGPRAWRLYTDGASNNGGSRAGLIMITPNDVEYSYALHLNFSNSNNEAEYEALLARLRIATEMFRITHIPRAENRKADALSKLEAVQFDHLSKEVLVKVLNERSVKAQEKGMLPEDLVDARTLMEKIGNYMMKDGVLYRKSYLVPLMRCVGPLQANYIIREVHMGSCEMHDGPREVVAKAMNLRYYWTSMHRDARELIRACDDCQAHASVPRLPKVDMISVTLAWTFMKWGMDIVGPLPKGLGRVKFGIPATIITDNGNEAVERANRSLLRGIKTRMETGGPA